MSFLIFLFIFLQRPFDSGPIYHETDMSRLPVEPFNTVSNLIFLFTVIYFARKVSPHFSKQKYLTFVLIVLFIGFVGGTVYHATRSHEVWLVMDWLPIVILSLSTVFYFFYRLRLKWYYSLLAIFGPITISFLMRLLPLPKHISMMSGYMMIALVVLIPVFTHLAQTQWLHLRRVLLSIFFFTLAISFRTMDAALADTLPMGTHWLWHLFGGLAVFHIIAYVYRVEQMKKVGE